MGWVAIVIAFLKSVPDIISLLTTVKGIVDEVSDIWQRRAQLKQINDALKKAKATGDTSDLEKIFRPSSSSDVGPKPA
jgi:hypothetical protein